MCGIRVELDSQLILGEGTRGNIHLEKVLAIATSAGLTAYSQGPGDFAAFLRLGQDLRLDLLGRCALPLLSFGAYHAADGSLFAPGVFDPRQLERRPLPENGVAEDVACSFFAENSSDPALSFTAPDAERKGAYSWAKAPRLGGEPAETGAAARQAVDGDALARALVADQGGTNVYVRVVARVMEIARLTVAAEAWARALRLDESFCETPPAPVSGQVVGMVEAARGALGHWMTLHDKKIARHQIIAPTTWNFSPRDDKGVAGPLEQALVGVEVGSAGARAPAIQHVVRSFDPCMVCTAH